MIVLIVVRYVKIVNTLASVIQLCAYVVYLPLDNLY